MMRIRRMPTEIPTESDWFRLKKKIRIFSRIFCCIRWLSSSAAQFRRNSVREPVQRTCYFRQNAFPTFLIPTDAIGGFPLENSFFDGKYCFFRRKIHQKKLIFSSKQKETWVVVKPKINLLIKSNLYLPKLC